MKRLLCYIAFTFLTGAGFSQNLSVTNLRCEYRKDPLGVAVSKPKLSWELQSAQQHILQTAYRVLVADDPKLLIENKGNIWDSKKINSSASIQVAYNGKPLLAAKKYFWKVMVWDNKKNISDWSSTAMWQMGLLSQQDWGSAKWITNKIIDDTAIIAPHVHLNGKRSWGARGNVLPLLRKDFSVGKPVKSATVFICGLGQFEMHINGKKIGDHFLDPGWTNYKREAQYVTFDVADVLKSGINTIGVMLGNGFYYIPGQRYRKMTGAYGYPKMIMRMLIEYTDGSNENIISDQGWNTFDSPVIFSSIYGGEDYDATTEQDGWDQPNFLIDGKDWWDVTITTGPVKLESQQQEPIKVMENFAIKSTRDLGHNVSVYDLGQNFSGIPAIKVAGKYGDTVRMYCAELLNADGTANQKATGSPSYFTYILNGKGEESWQPRFSYTGFRYIQVQCIPKDSAQPAPIVIDIQGLHTRNAATAVGSFHCSDDLFNRTYTLIDWAIKSNMVSVFTDCPHREKLGWLEQTHLMGESVQYNYDVAALCRKVINDMKNAQYPDGKIPEIAPEFTVFTPPFDESPEWGSAAVILPWYTYRWYGDKQTLAEAYDMMKAYVMYLKNKAKDNILSHGLGDWYDIGPNRPGLPQMTKMGITATAMFYYDLSIMQQVAKKLTKTADQKMFEQLAFSVKRAFNDRFLDKQKLQYDSASQTANAMALFMGLVEAKNKDAVVNALVKDIRDRNNALTAGDVGYRYVLKVLEEAGRNDVIFDMNNRDDVPGYGFQLKHGATALTESWQALESVSNNHFMLGHLMEWFYAGLAGIRQSDSSVAYKDIIIEPQPVGDITSAKATYHSPYGQIVSEWKKNGDEFELNVEIPPNSMATVYMPGRPNPAVSKNGSSMGAGVKDGKMFIRVGSGKYHFKLN
jgi:alpha-L-rhamnosidase